MIYMLQLCRQLCSYARNMEAGLVETMHIVAHSMQICKGICKKYAQHGLKCYKEQVPGDVKDTVNCLGEHQ